MLLNLETAAFGYFWTGLERQNCAGLQNVFDELNAASFPARCWASHCVASLRKIRTLPFSYILRSVRLVE
jgi:hypothetical protein